MRILLAVISAFLFADIKLYDACSALLEAQFQNNCYITNDQPGNFQEAEFYCTLMKGNLVSILNDNENKFIEKMVGGLELDGWKEIYIGLTSLNETSGKYHWVDGSPLKYTNWKKGEPDHPNENKCVFMRIKDGEWVAANCINRKVPMVCKRPDTS